MRHPPPTYADELELRPTTFQIAEHTLVVAKLKGRGCWTVAVDGRLLDASFACQADAWEAGVREADRIDRAPRP
jgi:hypothetical protein